MFVWTTWNVSYVVVDKETNKYMSSIATQTLSGLSLTNKRSVVAEFAHRKRHARNILAFSGKKILIVSVVEVFED